MSYRKRHFQMRYDMLAEHAFTLGVTARAWERLVSANKNLQRIAVVYTKAEQ